MIWKHEVNVDDANTAKKFKQEILAISPDIVVSVIKNKSQWLVRSSVEEVGGGLDNKVVVTRALKALYDKYSDKISYHNESIKKKSILRKLVEKVLKDTWTPERVKDELPDVKVKLPNGKIVTGKVYGRKNQFANVVVKTDAGNKSEEFSWNTLARALNNNSSVTI